MASPSRAASIRSFSPTPTSKRSSSISSSPPARAHGGRRRIEGLTVPARSIRVVDLGAPGAGAQSEPILAVSVEVSRGRLVVGRSQRFLGGGRLGTQVTLASPALRDQWWFVNGDKGPGVSERYSIYNPTDNQVEVDVDHPRDRLGRRRSDRCAGTRSGHLRPGVAGGDSRGSPRNRVRHIDRRGSHRGGAGDHPRRRRASWRPP